MKRTQLIVALVLYTVVLVYFSFAHLEESSLRGLQIDKFYHGLAYAGLAALLTCVVQRRHSILLMVALTVSFGLLMEAGQYFIPFRNASITDAAANGAGAIVGAYGGVWLRARLGLGKR
ncbi:MAG: VanZ family protein [Proteobacteria bacterium]|nr:VanZ family protein [Pseudomonadota bacterium]